MKKIVDWKAALKFVEDWKKSKLQIVFTNGCFDILHKGHIYYLEEAKSMGDKLIVGLNSDRSVQNLKGKNRPVNSESERARLLSALTTIDLVIIFSEETPHKLIEIIKPNILVKGGDYKESEIIGSEIVRNNGGQIVIVPFLKGYSTSQIIQKQQ